MIKMEQCPHCEKKMPKHILVKHLAKSHATAALEEVEEKRIKQNHPNLETKTETSIQEPKKWYEWYEKWDAGEITTCGQCKMEWPSKLMGFHLKLEHGI